MSKTKEQKTNVMRILEQKKVPYQAHTYPHGGAAVDGLQVAQMLEQDPGQVFKTLVTRGHSGEYCVFVIPVEKELDLKAAARAAGEKAVEMIPVKDINKVTGYVRGGCSPIGMKKQYRTVVDDSCQHWDTVIFSAGKIGYQVEVSPAELPQLCGATWAPITKNS